MYSRDDELDGFFEAFTDYLNSLPKKDSMIVPNLQRVSQVDYAYNLARKSLCVTGAIGDVICGQLDCDPTHGYIEFKAKSFEVFDMDVFIELSKLSDSIEVMPLSVDGILIAFGFKNVATRATIN